jgi:hypothetical protein
VIFHPSERTLSRYSDGELTGLRAKRVAAHLEGCADCRAVVASFRELGASARNAAAPAMRGGVWERIAERRGGGERVILPQDAVSAAARGTRWVAVAAAVLVIASVVIVARPLVRHAAAADRSALTFSPALPRPGATVAIHYRPDARLADEGSLHVRARFYSSYLSSDASDFFAPRGIVVAALTKNADGSFGGTMQFPDSAAYALLIVENADGSQIDTDHRGLFDLVAAAPNGRPSFDGLLARVMRRTVACCIPGTSGRALAAADSLVAIYPDSAQSWAARVSTEGSSRIPHWLSVFSARERRFAALEKSLAMRPSVSAAEMGAMARFAAMIEDSAAAVRWRARLLESYPSDPRSLVMIAWDEHVPSADSARAVLPRFEEGWANRSDARELIAELGLGMAITAKDTAAIGRWASRYETLPAPGVFLFQSSFLTDPATRTTAHRQLDALVREVLAEPRVSRDLYYTRQQDSLRRRFVAARALVTLSDGMLSDSQPRLALDTMNVAVRLVSGAALPVCGTNGVYRERARVFFALGDSASGNRDLAAGARSDSAPGKTCVRWAAAP